MGSSTETPFDVLTATAVELQNLLQDGKITSVKIVAVYQRHIEKYNPKLRAIISTQPNVMKMAQALDERQQGKIRGPLHGIPIIIKVHLQQHVNYAAEFIGCFQHRAVDGHGDRSGVLLSLKDQDHEERCPC